MMELPALRLPSILATRGGAIVDNLCIQQIDFLLFLFSFCHLYF